MRFEEAFKRQESLKADYKAAIGGEVILLTTNVVKGREVFPELKERLEELRRENVIS